jgi:hypothetical protein
MPSTRSVPLAVWGMPLVAVASSWIWTLARSWEFEDDEQEQMSLSYWYPIYNTRMRLLRDWIWILTLPFVTPVVLETFASIETPSSFD